VYRSTYSCPQLYTLKYNYNWITQRGCVISKKWEQRLWSTMSITLHVVANTDDIGLSFPFIHNILSQCIWNWGHAVLDFIIRRTLTLQTLIFSRSNISRTSDAGNNKLNADLIPNGARKQVCLYWWTHHQQPTALFCSVLICRLQRVNTYIWCACCNLPMRYTI